MLDESMFEDIHEIAENSAYLKAVEERDVSLEMLEQLPPYEECFELEKRLREEGQLAFSHIFDEPTGYYMLKCFLIADYCVDKAIFIKDVEQYRSMRFESARKRISTLLYHRFVSQDGEWPVDVGKGQSVFALVKNDEKRENFTAQQTNAQPLVQTSQNGKFNQSSAGQLNIPTLTEQSQLQMPSQSHASIASTTATISIGPQAANTTITNQATHTIEHTPSSPATSMISSVISEESILKTNPDTMWSIGHSNNAIGVYGKSVKKVKARVIAGEAPKDLFDDVAMEVLTDLKLDVFPRFLQSDFYRRYIRTKMIETQKVSVKDFTNFRVLGRGGFGAVHACRKKNSGQIYAMKCINKKLVKVKSALDNVLEERNVLTMMKTHFVTNLKYALQDDESLYLIMDLMLGGDLKFHLINAGRFTEKRARFYAAQVLLGLEHVHRMSIIYRDLKLENVLLDNFGNAKISDLGLAVVTKVKIKGYAGTPGYTAPEMIRNKLYGPSADIFSFGVMLYRMLCGSKPFKGKIDRDLDKAVLEKKPAFPKEVFNKESMSLISALLAKRPEQRIGCGDRGIEDIKEHPFFESIDWGLLESGYLDPPFVPDKFGVNAAPLKDIGDFDRTKYRNVKLDDRFKQRVKGFEWVNVNALQDEMVNVLTKADENVNFEKFAQRESLINENTPPSGNSCCVVL
jgi:rhodopsin kinase